jgi:hypothetical protein
VRYHDRFAPRGSVVSSARAADRTLVCAEDDAGEHLSLFPEEQFLRKCEMLGFNRNSPVISLMPLLAVVRKAVL